MALVELFFHIQRDDSRECRRVAQERKVNLRSLITVDINGLSPLHVAAQSGAAKCVEWLLTEGVEAR